MSDLVSGLPTGVTASQGQLLTVKRGTAVLQAAPASSSQIINFSNPNAQFYVLRDHVALLGSDITNPQQSTDSTTSQPDVTFGFTSKGQHEFQAVTKTIARRGDLVSGLGQHLRPALRGRARQPADHRPVDRLQAVSRTASTAPTAPTSPAASRLSRRQDLATQLRLGALPIKLKLISESQVSATLGKQALNQGLVAGVAGLLIVAIFLIAFYRVLGLIATAGLIVYGIYFYALIKIIPITMTLPGIAGLILTIGVAADANIVIFERVKEEIRDGQIDPPGHRHRLPQGPDGDHRRQRGDDPDRVHPVRARDRRRQGLCLHARHRHDRLAVHRGDGHAGDPHHDG